MKEYANHISYSQLSMYEQCPHRWKLNYIDGKRVFTDSIYTIFGSAMHAVIQQYLITMYGQGIKEADALNLNGMLSTELKNILFEIKKSGEEIPCTKQEIMEFYVDGMKIIEYFKKNRARYFPLKNTSLLGVELQLSSDLGNNVEFTGFIDVILQNNVTHRIKVVDIKTSTRGWNKYQKADKSKTNQVLLYKHFYAKEYNIPVDRIDIEYFIVKRKLYEQSEFPQKRIQLVIPPSGKPSINKTLKSLNNFLETAFTENGEYNLNHTYQKFPSDNNCRWCEYKDNTKLCDRKKL